MGANGVSRVTLALTVAAFAWAAGGVALGEETARGVVFEDLNGNGRLDAGEPGIPEVAVSNQDGVVVTDDQGRYSVPVSDDTIIFVVKPSGYTVPVDEDRLPRFYYIHKPSGSPRLYYGGVDPTGPLPESIDFPLTRALEPVDFTIIALADPQPETLQEVHYVRDDVLSELVNAGAAFGVTLGDIVSDQLDLIDEHNKFAGKVGFPFYNVIGNHDMNYDAAGDRDSDETFHRFFGPNYYSWNCGRVHFIALDSVEWLGPPQGRGRYRGALGEGQLRWLERDLALVPDDDLVVLLSHIPITTTDGRAWVDKDGLFAVLKNRKNVLAINGHTHYQEHMFFDTGDGWMGSGSFHQLNIATASGAWWSGPKDVRGIPVSPCRDGVPNGYTVVTFKGSDYTTEFKAAGFDRDHQMRIYPPGSMGHDDLSGRTILVNVFDGSHRSRVEYSLDRGPFQPMERAPRRDPLAEVLLEGVVDSGKPWAYPVVTEHIWQAELPERPARGAHVVTVRVTDHFGRVREQSSIFGR